MLLVYILLQASLPRSSVVRSSTFHFFQNVRNSQFSPTGILRRVALVLTELRTNLRCMFCRIKLPMLL